MIKRGSLKIVLLSDTCCGSGVTGSVGEDIATTYDEMGLPVINGKRIKGMLRENVDMMIGNGYITDKSISKKLFGTPQEVGALKIFDAKIANAEEIKDELKGLLNTDGTIFKECAGANYIKQVFNMTRHSTAIEQETQLAKEHSLRTMGLIPKGNVFFADISLEYEQPTDGDGSLCKALEDACALLRGIGVSRNRGLGEVRCSIVWNETSKNGSREAPKPWKSEPGDDDRVIHIEMEAEEAIISRESYIKGAAIQGFFANEFNKDKNLQTHLTDLLGKTKFSMLYPVIHMEEKSVRSRPSPIGMVYKKYSDKDGEQKVYNFARGYKAEVDCQYKGFHAFGYPTDKEYHYVEEESGHSEYHFSKSSRTLYTETSLRKGSCFKGFIVTQTREMMDEILSVLKTHDYKIRLGASKTAQYSTVKITKLTFSKDLSEDLESTANDRKRNNANQNVDAKCGLRIKKGQCFVLEFLSDMIPVDRFGRNTTNREVLEEYVNEKFNKPKLLEIYIQTKPVGGYNSTWKLPKRRFDAFKPGTQLKLEATADISCNAHDFMGLMQGEGFGEYRLSLLMNDGGEYIKREQKELSGKDMVCGENSNRERGEHSIEKKLNYSKEILKEVLCRRILQMLQEMAIKEARSYIEKNRSMTRSTAMRIINAYKASEQLKTRAKMKSEVQSKTMSTFKGRFQNYVNCNYSGKSNREIKEFSENMFKIFDDTIKKFSTGYALDSKMKEECVSENDDRLFKAFAQAYISEAKLRYQEGSK